MATCYKILDTRSKKAQRFPLKIAVSHRKKTKYIGTDYYLKEEEWDSTKQKICPPFVNSGKANAMVSRKFAIAEEVIESLRPYYKQLNVDQIKEAIEERIQEEFAEKIEKENPVLVQQTLNSEKGDFTCLFKYAQGIIQEYYLTDRGGSARTIEDMVKSLKKFTGKKELFFKHITESFIRDYERWYLQQENSKGERNTINGFGFRTKDMRRLFNLAIKDKQTEVTQEMYPFGRQGYSIKKEKTDTRNVDPTEIAKLYTLDLKEGSELWHHVNYFKYYFECWGMNFADIAYLRVYQVEGGKLKYRRRKTRWSNSAKKFEIQHSAVAQKIIDYYTQGKRPNDFVFPIIHDIYYLTETIADKDQELANKKSFEKKFDYRRANHIRRLKTISKLAGLKNNITIYVSRHSFFSIALQNGVSKSLISELAGHADFQTTENYLSGFNGVQLAEGAELVRNAVAQHAESPNILSDKIILTQGGEELSVRDFLSNENTDDATQLLISMLQKTNCSNGIKAQEYIDAYTYHLAFANKTG